MSILRRRRLAGLTALALPITALVVAVLVLTWGHGAGTPVAADDSSAGMDISMEGVGAGCDSGAGEMKCDLEPGDTLTLNIYLNALPSKITQYEGVEFIVSYTGVTSKEDGTLRNIWPECEFPASFHEPGRGAFGCGLGLSFPNSSYTGHMATATYNCPAEQTAGTITLVSGSGNTTVTETVGSTFPLAADQTFTVNCGEPVAEPTATNTAAPPTPTNTPCDGPCPTDTPTNTPPPATDTPTPTDTPEQQMGDVNGDGQVNSQDALWVLWYVAEIVDEVPFPAVSDVNEDGVINALDATLILQYDAGLIDSLPV